MNLTVDLSFPFKTQSVSVKIIHNLLFVEACEFEGVKGVDCTKRFFKKCKKIMHVQPDKLKAFYKRGKVRICDSGEKLRGEVLIKINITHASMKKPRPEPLPSSITYAEFQKNMMLMGMIV